MTSPSLIGSFLVGAIVFSVIACSSIKSLTTEGSLAVPDFGQPTLQARAPQLVAILPFRNLTSNSDIEEETEEIEIIRTAFSNHFSSRGYTTQWVKLTDKLLRERELVEVEDINRSAIDKLAQITKAEALIFGELTHFNRLYLGVYAQVAVGVRAKMVDGKTGTVLWAEEDVSRGHTGGFSMDPMGIAITLATNALALRKIELLREADNLFRDMVKTIPFADMAEDGKRPTITLLINEAATRSIRAGEDVRVGMTGDPELQASFDLGDYRLGVPMDEVKPGVYLGSYRVKPGESAEQLTVRGYLKNPTGLTTKWMDALGPVAIDTTPPEPPQGVVARSGDHSVSLKWDMSPEPDLAGYRVYRSMKGITGFKFRAITETPTFVDQDLRNDRRYFYKVVAFDKAGNESRHSVRVAGTPIRPGPTFVRDDVSMDTNWVAAASPYILEKDILVAEGATLSVEPGTEVRSKGGALRVRGRLLGKGEPNHVILFTADASAPSNRWSGILFDQTGDRESSLEHVRITKAETGITCSASSPNIVGVDISENDIGIMIRAASAHPVLEMNHITMNSRDGIQVRDGARPIIIGNQVLNNGRHGIEVLDSPALAIRGNALIGNHGFQIHNAEAQNPIDSSGNWWGTTDGASILAKVSGSVAIRDYLGTPKLDGSTIPFLTLESRLGGAVEQSSFLTVANSPYDVTQPLIIKEGVTLTIQAGVTIKFRHGKNSIIVRKGTLRALGSRDRPILFTSGSAMPMPGDYQTAVQFEAEGDEPSFLQYVGVLYAEDAFVVKQGGPEIDHAFIGQTLRSGLSCLGESNPRISYSTITGDSNMVPILCSGQSRPMLLRNHILGNPVAVRNRSAFPVGARHNWWGSPKPGRGLFVGDVEYLPCLDRPDPEVFAYTQTDNMNPAMRATTY